VDDTVAFITAAATGPAWVPYVGLLAAAGAAIGLLSYLVGAIRPLAVRKARYWHEAGTTRFSCAIVNRSLLFDRSVDAISFVTVPPLWKRAARPLWRRQPQSARFLPWGTDVADLARQPMKLTKRQSQTLRGEIRTPTGPGDLTLPADVRIQAHSGGKVSRGRRVKAH
jgi:hypothetical protein